MKNADYPVAFFANGIGDSLLALPTLRALSYRFNGKLRLICESIWPWYESLPLRDIMVIPKMGKLPGGARTFDVGELSRSISRADVFISLVTWQSLALSALIDSLHPDRIVRFRLDSRVEVSADSVLHPFDGYFKLAQCIDPSLVLDDFSGPLRLPEVAEQFALSLRQELPEWARVLIVHPDTKPAKCWSVERFIELLDLWLTERPEFIAWVVGMPYGPLDVGRQGQRVLSCVGFPLDVSMALVGRADLFLGVDSCMLHAADLNRVPGVGLFGPTSSTEWGFRFAPHQHIDGPLESISVDAVLAALDDCLHGNIALEDDK
jgi:hypothetical protein